MCVLWGPGLQCPFAHSNEEIMYHPLFYKRCASGRHGDGGQTDTIANVCLLLCTPPSCVSTVCLLSPRLALPCAIQALVQAIPGDQRLLTVLLPIRPLPRWAAHTPIQTGRQADRYHTAHQSIRNTSSALLFFCPMVGGVQLRCVRCSTTRCRTRRTWAAG